MGDRNTELMLLTIFQGKVLLSVLRRHFASILKSYFLIIPFQLKNTARGNFEI